jgi:hypothetical protein
MTAPSEIVARRLFKQAEWCKRQGLLCGVLDYVPRS